MNIEMDRIRIMASPVILAALMIVAASAADSTEDSVMKCDIFNTEEILDESTLDIKTLEDWHSDKPTNSTRQKLIEIKVAEWWPGKDYRIPVRMADAYGGSMIALRQVPPRSCMSKSPKTNGWIWNVMQRLAHGLQPYR